MLDCWRIQRLTLCRSVYPQHLSLCFLFIKRGLAEDSVFLVTIAFPNTLDLVLTSGIGLGPVKFGFSKEQVFELLDHPDELFQVDTKSW